MFVVNDIQYYTMKVSPDQDAIIQYKILKNILQDIVAILVLSEMH